MFLHKSMLFYRRATPAEAPAYTALATRMLVGTAYSAPTLKKVQGIIAHPDRFVLGVWDGDTLIAFMCGCVAECYINNDIWAHDQGLFVSTERRGAAIAKVLVHAFESWARERGACKLWLGQSVNNRKESTLRFYERLGYSCQGFNTCKDL